MPDTQPAETQDVQSTHEQLNIDNVPVDTGAIQGDSVQNEIQNTTDSNDGGSGNGDNQPSTPIDQGTPSPESTDGSQESDLSGRNKDDSAATPQSLEYVLNPVENSLLTPDRVAEIESFAKENGLTQDVAQSILEKESESVNSLRDSLVEQQKELTQKWLEEVKTDKEIGGPKFDESVTLAKQAVEKFGTPELKHYLDVTGLGNNVEMVRLFTKLGKAIANDSFVLGGSGNLAKEKTNAEVFYPESAA